MTRPPGPDSAAHPTCAWRDLPASALDGRDPDGDPVRRLVLDPALVRMTADGLGGLAGRSVLDAGCGTGEVTRLLAEAGARVTALDVSPVLLEHAREAGAAETVCADLLTADLPRGHDAVVASLVLCVIPDWTAALAACLRALRPGGLLVIAVEHPCFDQGIADWTRTGIAETTRYLSEFERPGAVAPDYHRPLSTYVTGLLAAGCTVTALAEPGVDEATAAADRRLRPLRELPLFLLLAARSPHA